MTFDFADIEPHERYKLLISTVVPRPIAWVTSVDSAGVVNAAPFSFFNAIGGDPPLVVLGLAPRPDGEMKDTAANIRNAREFVVNMVSHAMIDQMNICAADFPPGESEPEAAGLRLISALRVGTPMLADAPANLECVLHTTLEIGRNRVIIAEVVAVHVREELVDVEKLYVDYNGLDLVGRMGGGGGYTRTTDTFDLPRLSYTDWLAEQQSPGDA